MRFLNLILILLMWTEAVFAVSTTDNNKVVGKTLKVSDKFISGTNFVNGEFEDSIISGWTVAHSALTSLIPTSTTTAGTALSVGAGLTAATNLALTATSTNPLAGSYSGLLTASAASTAGDLLISPAISIPNSAKAKMITIGFSYSASSAINLSGTASNSFAVYVYDIDNATWIQPQGVYGMIDGSTYAQVKNITFQTSSNGTKYQLAIVNINSIAAYTLKIDEIYFGTQPYSSGAAMSDCKAYTPTLSWTTGVSSTSFCSRRVGDSVEITGYISLSGAPTAAQLTATIPSGLMIDGSKTMVGSNSSGIWNALSTNAGAFYSGLVNANSTTTFYFHVNGNGNVITNTIPVTWKSGDYIMFTAKFPIAGWSSNTVQSADSDDRATVLQVSASSGTIASGGTDQLVTMSTVGVDSHSMWNGTTTVTIPSSGYYDIGFYVGMLDVMPASAIVVKFKVNGATSYPLAAATSPTQYQTVGGSYKVKLNAGEQVSFYVTNMGSTTASIDLARASIAKLSGSPIVQASESVSARYTNSAGTTIGVADTVIPFATKVFDSHSAYNTSTGVYTCPVSGKYRISSRITTVSSNWAAGTYLNLHLYKNGSFNSLLSLTYGTGASLLWSGGGTDIVDCKQSETIAIYANAYAQVNLLADSTRNYLTIERIGN